MLVVEGELLEPPAAIRVPPVIMSGFQSQSIPPSGILPPNATVYPPVIFIVPLESIASYPEVM